MSARMDMLEEIKRLEAEIADLQQKAAEQAEFDRETAIDECIAVAKKWGFDAYDLFAPVPEEPKKRGGGQGVKFKGVPKYRDRASGKTWSGNGRTPGWLVDYESAGGSRDDLLINK